MREMGEMHVNVPDFLRIRVREEPCSYEKPNMVTVEDISAENKSANCKIILYGNELSSQDTTQPRI